MSALDVQVGGDHYKKLKIQPVEYMHANGIPFIEGCIIKYASRWRDKGGIADLEKIKHFAQLLIDLEEAEAASEQCKPVDIIPAWDMAPVDATHLLKANFDIDKNRAYQFARLEGGLYLDMYQDGTSFFMKDNSWVVHSARPQQ